MYFQIILCFDVVIGNILVTTFDSDVLAMTKGQNADRLKRRVGVPRSGRFGQPCTYNTDCLQNMYCPAGSCLCLPGFVDVSIDCLPIINPDQEGCTVDRQCSGAWPSAKCVNGKCVCPDGQFIAETQDGLVCFTPGRCPLPESYAGPLTSTLDALGHDFTGCLYLDHSRTEKSSCFADGQYQGDIYDCIPKSNIVISGALGHCCPAKALTCIQPKSTFGGTENRYWYNSVTGTCEPFAWNSAGTIGNSNNFRAYEHCIAYCSSTCKRGTPLLASGKAVRCSGNDACSSSGQKQYSCSRTSFGQNCCPTKENICSPFGGRNYHEDPLIYFDIGSSGIQMTSETRWYWNGFTCETFSYKGFAGNFNNFLSYNDCKAFCGQSLCQQGDPLKSSNGVFQQCSGSTGCPTSYECVRTICCPKKQTVCIQPKLTGGCNQPSQRYWFNSETRECETMIYSGCNGNDNNFKSYLDCQNFCRETTAQPKCVHGEAATDLKTGRHLSCSSISIGHRQTQCPANYECYYDGFLFGCCPTKAHTCSIQPVTGNLCVTATVRWFYDTSAKICKSFQFLGCNGNSNNFLTKQQCEQYCSRGLCPYGAEPYQNIRRICSTPDACPIGYQCIETQSDGIGYCCPTRARICSEKPDNGQQCSEPTEKFYFNPMRKQCSTFTFLGCGGNGNKFSTLSQCNNFCTSTSCNDGETAYLDPNTHQPSACKVNVSSSCPVGFICKLDLLTNRNICCGRVETNLCSPGERTYIEALTMAPLECSPRADICPTKYLCKYNEEQGRHYCCSADKTAMCPAGRSVYLDHTIKQPVSCYISAINPCPAGFSCQATTAKSLQRFCCSIYDLCPNGDKFTMENLNNSPTRCSISNQTCPIGFTCHSADPMYDSGHCCPNVYIVHHVRQGSEPKIPKDQCPSGHIPYREVDGSAKLCDLNKRSTCPAGYSCHFSRDLNRSQCCGLNAGCPNHTVAYINPTTGMAQNCTNRKLCIRGFSCQLTTFGYSLCCTKVAKVATNTINGAATECLERICPDGYKCMYSHKPSKYICCSDDTPSYDDCPIGSVPSRSKHSSLCDSITAPCPANYECTYIARRNYYQCCPERLPFENDPISNATEAVNDTCNDKEKKKLGQLCCANKQCLYSCGAYKESKICLCPRHLLLDATKEPYKCSSSCSANRDGAICMLESVKFLT